MQNRHRIPTIFNLYMVDVLCCALGCVILLWQMNYFEAQEQGSAADQAGKRLTEAKLRIDALGSEVNYLTVALESSKKSEVLVRLQLEDSRKQHEKVKQLALVYKNDYDEARKALELANALVSSLRVDVKDLQKKSTATAAELAGKIKEHADLLTRMAAAQTTLRDLEKDLATKTIQGQLAAKNVASISLQLKDSQTQVAKLEKQVTDLRQEVKDRQAKLAVADERAVTLEKQEADLRKQVKDHQAKLTVADDRIVRLEKQEADLRKQVKDSQTKLNVAEIRAALLDRDVTMGKQEYDSLFKRFQDMLQSQDAMSKRLLVSTKDLADTKLVLESLRSEKLSLLTRTKLLMAAAENRFAGITLTGQRVIFLVDMSGSMELIDESTKEPDKWPLVCETLGKVMASLPDLKKYQVILFSDKVRYPFGNERKWLDYNPDTSKRSTVDGLNAIAPKGGTNMFTAFEEAFTFRADGLDTIYVLSDGLPNIGPGVPTTSTLTESQKTELLSKRVRQTLKTLWNRPLEGQRVRINTIGFFFESPDVGAFLWALAREHDGSFVGMSKP